MIRALLLLFVGLILSGCAVTVPQPQNALEAIAEAEASISVAARSAEALFDAGVIDTEQTSRIYQSLVESAEILTTARRLSGLDQAAAVDRARVILEIVQKELQRAQAGGGRSATTPTEAIA